MAAEVPVTKGTAGYVPPGFVYANHASNAPDTVASGRIVGLAGLRHTVHYFSDIDSLELWTTPPAGLLAVALQPADADATVGNATINAARQVVFTVGNNQRGWLHCLSRGGKVRAAGTDVPPITKGTAQWLNPNLSIRRNEHAAVPDTVANTRNTYKLGLKMHVRYFDGIDDTDTYALTYGKRVVAVAWQANTISDPVMPYFVNDTVTFFSGAADNEGWLWYWTRG
jgi:hypothetical protein